MNTFINALQTKDTLTENGMTTNSSTLSDCTDLFFQIGAMRNSTEATIQSAFVKAFAENPLIAMKMLFWARDIRGGAGERKVFRSILKNLAYNNTEVLRKNLAMIPEYGRWDDLFVLFGSKLENDVLELIKFGLNNQNGLCAKWMPRPSIGSEEKRKFAKKIAKHLGMSHKHYRQLLSKLSKTVEQDMCAKNWEGIAYDKIPSKAMSDYNKAFKKHDESRFDSYLKAVEEGRAKMNAGALYPYDVVKNMKHGTSKGADVQWTQLPNYLTNTDELILPIVDVSGSMDCPAGGNPNVTCLDISVSLGLYISERNEGPFKDYFITFSAKPQLQKLKGTLTQRYQQLSSSQWQMNTDIEAVYKLILNQAKINNVKPEDMPTMLLILSDMEFDYATTGAYNYQGGYADTSWNPTAHDMAKKMYEDAGYKMPKVVYWNLNARNKNFPVQKDEIDTALISGFSPAILKNVLACKDFTPITVMMETLNSKRYEPIVI